MPEYIVEMSRCFVRTEVAEVTVKAISETAARKMAKQIIDNDATAEAIAWEVSNGSYDHYQIDDVVEQSEASAS